MIYRITQPESFKKENLKNWYANSEYWMMGKMRHIKDIYDETKELLKYMLENMDLNTTPNLIDLGCGEGWLLRLILKSRINVNYTGIDFNIKFVEKLRNKHKEKNVEFICCDLENAPSLKLRRHADITVNFFNFFEIPNIDKAFASASDIAKPNSYLLIATIDPIMQILSISDSYSDFKSNLILYEKHNVHLGYDKKIDVINENSERFYKGVLYSISTYISLALKNGFYIDNYREVIKTTNPVPQIYQFLIFRKKDERR